jgi:hypothetical protein
MGFRQSTSNKIISEADEFIDMDIGHEKYLLTTRTPKKQRFGS